MSILRSAMVVVFVTLGIPSQAMAHHAAGAVFTDEEIEVEGIVSEFNFVNPHVNIMLDVTDETGAETRWMVTGPAAPPMRRWGWTADTVQPGQLIRFAGKKSRTGAPMLLIESAEIQSGRFVELDPADGSIIRRLQEAPDDSQAPDANLAVALALEDGRPNLSGMWLGGLGRTPNPPPDFNAAGAALQAEFDALNDPAFAECADHGLVRQAMSGHPLRITRTTTTWCSSTSRAQPRGSFSWTDAVPSRTSTRTTATTWPGTMATRWSSKRHNLQEGSPAPGATP